MGLVEDLKKDYALIPPEKKKVKTKPKVIVKYVPYNPYPSYPYSMYAKPIAKKRRVTPKPKGVSYGSMLRKAQAKDRYDAYMQRKRQAKVDRAINTAREIGYGARRVGEKTGRVVSSISSGVRQAGINAGIMSIYGGFKKKVSLPKAEKEGENP